MPSTPLPLPENELAVGDRFPNFLLPDQEGKARWFLERTKGNSLIVFVDVTNEILASLGQAAPAFDAAGLDRLAILGGTEDKVAATAQSVTPGFSLLADTQGTVGAALHRMTGIRGPFAVLLDANQRILALAQQADLVSWAIKCREQITPVPMGPRISQQAPVLIVPEVLSPALCQALMDRWEQLGHEEGIVHSIIDGAEVQRTYHAMKQRRDHKINDDAVLKPLMAVVGRRLAPELDKAFAFTQFKLDRFIITCYDSERGDYFRRHRDNQSPSTADRRFALTLNLNTPDYEGGELVFPEYGMQRYSPPAGGAILFSCSLLHEALPVSRGRRFTLLSFLRR